MLELNIVGYATVCFFSLWLLWLPGFLILTTLRLSRPSDLITRFSLQIGLGIAMWPLILLWSTQLAKWGLFSGWNPPSVRWLLLALTIVALLRVLTKLSRHARIGKIQTGWIALFFLLTVFTLSLRWQHITSIVAPNWVDSVHHTMIVRLLVDQGNLPTTYTPYLPESIFLYHWGFHALTAWLCWVMNLTNPFAMMNLVLLFGQVLNCLTLPMMYAGGKLLFSSRRAGIMAAVLAVFVSWYPAYYTSWGRYPHLLGLLLLSPMLIAFQQSQGNRRKMWQWISILSLLSAASLLVHIRTTLFALCLIALIVIGSLLQKRWHVIRTVAVTGISMIGLTLPWLYVLLSSPKLEQLLGASATTNATNSLLDWIPRALIWLPGISEIAIFATAGISVLHDWQNATFVQRLLTLVWIALLCIASIRHFFQHRSGRTTFPWWPLVLLFSWWLFVFLLASPYRLPLNLTGFLTVDSAAITVFVPICLATAGLVVWVISVLIPIANQRWFMIACTLVCAVLGAQQMSAIVNQDTVLLTIADKDALHWIEQNVPQEAKFAVNVQHWQGATYTGVDGGYWLTTLTGRASIIPPAIYTTVLQREQASQINQFLEIWSRVTSLDDLSLRTLLIQQGITHLYFGAKPGTLQPSALFGKEYTKLLYTKDSVYVFRLR